MALYTTHAEIDQLAGGRYRHTQHMKRIARRVNGSLVRDVHDWAAGDVTYPHAALNTSLPVYVADGMLRLCPTQEPARYVEFGLPYVKIGGVWKQVAFGNRTRTGNTITAANAQAILTLTHGGHFVDQRIELLGGYVPASSQVAFPVGMQGLTRSGLVFAADGVPVLSLRPFAMIDLANPQDVRPVDTKLTQVGGQWYALATLPSLTGMIRPCLDPTLTLQPDDTDGKDTWLREWDGGNDNMSTEQKLETTDRGGGINARTLIEFNLATLPAAAIISSAVLSMWLYESTTAAGVVVSGYRLKRTWVESQATWLISQTGTNWTTAGGFHADDCEQTAFTSGMSTNEPYGEKTMTLTATSKSDLGAYGWLLKLGTSPHICKHRSSGYTTASERPKLVVAYTVPAAVAIARAPQWGRF